MKILLVTETENLEEKLTVLSPALDYCAIVVDKVEPAKDVLKRGGLSQDLLRPMDALKACVDKLKYDYILAIANNFYSGKINVLSKYGVPPEKIIYLASLHTFGNFQNEILSRYYCEHFKEFEIFSTGTSYAETSIDIRQFKRKTINLATSSQDLYYSFQIAKDVISRGGGARYVMRSSGLRPTSSTSTFPRHLT